MQPGSTLCTRRVSKAASRVIDQVTSPGRQSDMVIGSIYQQPNNSNSGKRWRRSRSNAVACWLAGCCAVPVRLAQGAHSEVLSFTQKGKGRVLAGLAQGGHGRWGRRCQWGIAAANAALGVVGAKTEKKVRTRTTTVLWSMGCKVV